MWGYTIRLVRLSSVLQAQAFKPTMIQSRAIAQFDKVLSWSVVSSQVTSCGILDPPLWLKACWYSLTVPQKWFIEGSPCRSCCGILLSSNLLLYYRSHWSKLNELTKLHWKWEMIKSHTLEHQIRFDRHHMWMSLTKPSWCGRVCALEEGLTGYCWFWVVCINSTLYIARYTAAQKKKKKDSLQVRGSL